jgi:hypothetical protein
VCRIVLFSGDEFCLIRAQCVLDRLPSHVLIDRDGDGLDVLETVAFTRGALAQLGERVDLWRVVRLLVVPFQLFAH